MQRLEDRHVDNRAPLPRSHTKSPAPGGARFIFRAEVIKPGRTLTISEARAYALRDGREHLIATMTGTLMAMQRREAPVLSLV